MNRNGSIDESCSHRIDAGFSFFPPNAPGFYRLAQTGMNRDESWPES